MILIAYACLTSILWCALPVFSPCCHPSCARNAYADAAIRCNNGSHVRIIRTKPGYFTVTSIDSECVSCNLSLLCLIQRKLNASLPCIRAHLVCGAAKRASGERIWDAHLAQEDFSSGYQGHVDQIVRGETIFICSQRSSARVQLRQG